MLIGEYTKGFEVMVDLWHMHGDHHILTANVWVDCPVGVKGEYE